MQYSTGIGLSLLDVAFKFAFLSIFGSGSCRGLSVKNLVVNCCMVNLAILMKVTYLIGHGIMTEILITSLANDMTRILCAQLFICYLNAHS